MIRERIKFDLLIHDLKVPLAVIDAGITSLLKRQEKYGPLTEGQEKVLIRALRNTKVTQTLVNDALELAKSREGIGNLVNFRLSALIEQALVEICDLAHCNALEKIKACTDLQLFRESLEEIGIQLSIDEGLWCEEVCLDEVKIKQILRNLLNNALKYRKSRVELEVRIKDGYIVFSVEDDGEGIPSLYHKKIFESYFQMNAADTCSVRGHGLGLAGVMVLVEDIGGKLFLESDEGKGAKFLVHIPLTLTK
ncbi:MAG: HAMP domain-containing histidine kinase [Desulfobacteraceae bacterium]|nr:HAMP domain-containing histidine kinase [Desulfobacteraceae bacterium]